MQRGEVGLFRFAKEDQHSLLAGTHPVEEKRESGVEFPFETGQFAWAQIIGPHGGLGFSNARVASEWASEAREGQLSDGAN